MRWGRRIRAPLVPLGRAALCAAAIASSSSCVYLIGEAVLRVAATAEAALSTEEQTLTLWQRRDFIRLETGSAAVLQFTITLSEVEGDEDIVTLEHTVRAGPGGDAAGLRVTRDFPEEGREVEEPETFVSKPTLTGLIPGTYTVTSTATVADERNSQARETRSTELVVEVVPPGTPEPLRLSSPRISPRGIAPGVRRAVTFRTLIAGVSQPPQLLYLDRVSNRGEFIAQETELRDNGKEPDAKAGDGFYSGRLEVGSEEETEFYFRLRTEYFGKTVTSGIALFPITRLPLGSRPSPGPLVDHPNGRDKIFTNEVLIGALAGVSPRRVQTIVAGVGDTLGLKPEEIGIAGYIPSIDSYLVEFKGEGTLQEVNRAISAFKTYAEVKYASHSVRGNPAAAWLSNIKVNTLRSSSLPSGLPVTGSSEIGVAIIDNGVNCSDLDLAGRCAVPNDPPGSPLWPMDNTDGCLSNYNTATAGASSTHGTKVAALVAGAQGSTNTIQGVDEGVAWDVTLLPFGNPPIQQQEAADAMDCAVTAGAHILNVSWEWEYDVPSTNGILYDAVCTAACNNRLIVAAAGNKACSTYSRRYPASYNGETVLGDPATTCTCPDTSVIQTNKRMLKVGGTDLSDNEGTWCGVGTPYVKSQRGEIYAPGWGVPVTDETDAVCASNGCYGTSWSAPLVSGCAAILGATLQWSAPSWTWDSTVVEKRIMDTADVTTSSLPLLDCFTAVKPTEFTISAAGAGSAPEGNPIAFDVTRSGDWPLPQTVDCVPSISTGDTASSTGDFASAPVTLTFSPTDSDPVTKTCAVNTVDDDTPERDETFTVTLTPYGNAITGTSATAKGTILNDDVADVMLVLDMSGSMLSPACPTCLSKLQVLKDAIRIFVEEWQLASLPDNRLGVTYFRTNVIWYANAAGDLLLPVADADSINTSVQGQNASNLTAMGGGLQKAITTLNGAASAKRRIILFTDGMQNVNPMVLPDLIINHDGTGRPVSNISPTDPPTLLDENLGINVHTIGVGATPSFEQKLIDIADATGGESRLTTDPENDLRDFFTNTLINVLQGASPQLLAYRHDTLATPTATETFTSNNGAKKIILKLSWKRGDQLSFRVEKDGVDLTEAGKIIDGPFYRFFSTDLPTEINGTPVTAGGDWHMHIEGAQGTAYEAATIVDEPLFEYDFSVGREDYVAGDPLDLTVRLSLEKQPVKDARRVTATVLRPEKGLGTLLSITPMPAEPPGFQWESGTTLGQKKLQLLTQVESFYRQLQPVRKTVTLRNNGDGTYSAAFPNTEVAGTYTVVFEVEGERPEIGTYHRTETQSMMVRFGQASLMASELTARALDDPVDTWNTLITIRPRDRFGNYLGVDYGHRIHVSLAPGGASHEIKDLGDGTYTTLVRVTPGTDPTVTVRVMDKTLYEGPLSWLKLRRRFSTHLGAAIPMGSFNDDYDPGYHMGFDVEYRLMPRVSLVGLLEYSYFNSGSPLVTDTYWWNLSANLRYEFTTGPLRPYVNGGAGVYTPETGSARAGLNLGLGLGYSLAPEWTIELGGDYHHVFTNGSDTKYFVPRIGVTYGF